MKLQHEKRRKMPRARVREIHPAGQDQWRALLNCGHTVTVKSVGKPQGFSYPCEKCWERMSA